MKQKQVKEGQRNLGKAAVRKCNGRKTDKCRLGGAIAEPAKLLSEEKGDGGGQAKCNRPLRANGYSGRYAVASSTQPFPKLLGNFRVDYSVSLRLAKDYCGRDTEALTAHSVLDADAESPEFVRQTRKEGRKRGRRPVSEKLGRSNQRASSRTLDLPGEPPQENSSTGIRCKVTTKRVSGSGLQRHQATVKIFAPRVVALTQCKFHASLLAIHVTAPGRIKPRNGSPTVGGLALALPLGVVLWATWALSADGVEAGELSRCVRCFFPGCCAAVLAGVF